MWLMFPLHLLLKVVVTVESSGKLVSQTMKGMVHREAPEVIRSKLSEYLRCLKEGKMKSTKVQNPRRIQRIKPIMGVYWLCLTV